MKKFGFTVRQEKDWLARRSIASENRPDRWTVSLPHQCSDWEITIAGDSGVYDGMPHEEAIDALQRFLAEGQEALEALRQRREIEE